MNFEEEFESTRAQLAVQLSEIGSALDALLFQQRLADEIRRAETCPHREEANFHANLLRLMGDAVAHAVLEPHTMREFARHRSRSASLGEQGDDFEFVLRVARDVAEQGFVPIVADLTHLLAVGDIVAASTTFLLIIECKNRNPPSNPRFRGRLWRQKQRRDAATRYLQEGHVEEGETIRIAVEAEMDERDDALIESCVLEAEQASDGAARRSLGPRDYLVAIWNFDDPLTESMRTVADEVCGDGWSAPLFGGGSSFLRESSPFNLNPYALKIDVRLRTALAEGDLMLWRFADIASIAGDVDGAERAQVDYERTNSGYNLVLQTPEGTFPISERFLDQILFDCRSVASIRVAVHQMCAQYVNYMREVIAEDKPASGVAARGSRGMNALAYRNPSDPDGSLLVFELNQLSAVGIPIPFGELEGLAATLDNSENYAFPVALVNQGGRTVVKLGSPVQVNMAEATTHVCWNFLLSRACRKLEKMSRNNP